MDDDKARILIRSLLDHPALEELDLSHNLIGDRGARAAAKLLSHSRLRVLNLANNQLQAPGAQSLAHALAHNTNLVFLNLRLNCIEDEGGQAIAHALETNKCLSVLHLGGNKLSEPTATLLSQMLTVNTTLVSLNLSCNHIGQVSRGFWGGWARVVESNYHRPFAGGAGGAETLGADCVVCGTERVLFSCARSRAQSLSFHCSCVCTIHTYERVYLYEREHVCVHACGDPK